MKSFALALVVVSAGCNLYFADDDVADDDCAVIDIVATELRDPATGDCFPISSCNGGDQCCPLEAQAIPDFGACHTQCDTLDEATCLATPLCRAAYNANSTIDVPPSFLECWSIAPSGPDPSGCDNLDAYQCSRHDNCIAFYDDFGDGLQFSSCKAELGNSCEAIDCDPGLHCEQQCGADGTCAPSCVPDNNECGPNSCPPGFDCVVTCAPGDGCETCTTTCQPSGGCEGLATEAECVSRADCTPVYEGTNCTCTPDSGCTCEILTYERCQAH